MTWPVFAVIQLAITTIGVMVVCGLRLRQANRENTSLREACALAISTQATEAERPTAPPATEPEEVVAARWLAGLSDRLGDEPMAEMLQQLISVIAQGDLDGASELLNQTPESDNSELQKAYDTLKAELDIIRAGAESSEDDAASAEELKSLLKQFTLDSREMMGCIQELEKENQALRAQLEQAEAA